MTNPVIGGPSQPVHITGSDVTLGSGGGGGAGDASAANQTNGTQKAIVRGGAKGSTTAADVTSTASGANHQPLDVLIYDASGNPITSFGGGTQYDEGATDATATGTVFMWKDASDVLRAASALKPLPIQQAAVNNLVTIASANDTAVTTATDTTLIAAPGAGNKIRVFYVHAANTGSTATQVMWRDGAAGSRRYRTSLVQNAAFAHNIKPDAWDLTANTALVLTTSAAGNVYWTVEYTVVAV